MNVPATTVAATTAAARARALVLALIALLVLVFGVWHLLRYRPATAALLLAIALPPWLLPLGGLRRGERRTYAGCTLLVLPYLAYATMETLANPGARAYAASAMLVAFALFVALVAFLRISPRPPLPAPSARTAP